MSIELLLVGHTNISTGDYIKPWLLKSFEMNPHQADNTAFE
jgi:hypothetical protein